MSIQELNCIPLPMDSFGNFTTFSNGSVAPCPCVPKKKEKQMRTEIGSIAIHTPSPVQEDSGRDHLLSRLRHIWSEKNDELYTKYVREDHPKTFGEAREWIKKGLYRLTVEESYKDDVDFHWHGYGFGWGKKVPDRDTFEKLQEKLTNAKMAAMDIIMVKTDEDARLKALKAFADWKE